MLVQSGTGTMVRIRHGVLRRGRRVVLEAGELVIPCGARVAIIGANGAGKTTLMLHLAGAALRAQSFEFAAHDGRTWTARTPRHAFAPQLPALPQWLEVRQVAALYGFTASALDEAAPGMRLNEVWTTRCSSLSTGQAQAVALALAMAADADVTLLDEPLAPLDFRRRVAARDLLAAARPRTMLLFSTQSARDLLDICEWVLVLSRGRYAFQGSVTQLVQPARNGSGAADRDVLERNVIALLEGDVSPL